MVGSKPHIVILGAGISGLSTAWFLQKRFGDEVKLTIIDQADRVGGWIRTHQDGAHLFEMGPRSLRTAGAGAETLQLVEELGLQKQVVSADEGSKVRYLWMDGKLQKLPNGLLSCLGNRLTKGLFGTLWRERKVPRYLGSDESIDGFIRRRFGANFASQLADPMVSGIFAGNSEELSIRACFPNIHRMEQQFGSVVRGMMKSRRTAPFNESPFIRSMQRRSMFSFKEGLEMLPNALKQHLKADFMLSSEVMGFSVQGEKVAVMTNRQTVDASHVVSTIPAHTLAPLVQPYDAMAATDLAELTRTSVIVVGVGYSSSVLKQRGFGYLIPQTEKEKILGVVWDSSIFPEQNRTDEETRLTVMMGGAHHPDLMQFSDPQIRSIALDALLRHLGIEGSPETISIFRANNAIPQYKVGHDDQVAFLQKRIADKLPFLTLGGNSYGGISVNDCVVNGRLLANSLKITRNTCVLEAYHV